MIYLVKNLLQIGFASIVTLLYLQARSPLLQTSARLDRSQMYYNNVLLSRSVLITSVAFMTTSVEASAVPRGKDCRWVVVHRWIIYYG